MEMQKGKKGNTGFERWNEKIHSNFRRQNEKKIRVLSKKDR